MRLAEEILNVLMPYCVQGEIVGSLRRGLSHVKDIDILVRPDVTELPIHNLFNEVVEVKHINPLANYLNNEAGWEIVKAGERTYTLNVRGMQTEIYMVFDARQWGGAMVVRTGPHQVSKRLMNFALFKHWHFKDYMIHQHEKEERGYHKGGCSKGMECPMIADTPREEDIFFTLGMDYLQPEARNEERLIALEKRALGLSSEAIWP